METLLIPLSDLAVLGSTLGERGIETFWGTGIGGVLGQLLGAAGVLLLIVAGIAAWKTISDGKMGRAVMTFAGAAVIASFLINPGLLGDAASVMGNLFETVMGSLDDFNTSAGS